MGTINYHMSNALVLNSLYTTSVFVVRVVMLVYYREKLQYL